MLSSFPNELEKQIRHSELARLEAKMSARSGHLLLVGGPGIGKSRVLRHLGSMLAQNTPSLLVDLASPATRTRLGLACAIMVVDPSESAALQEQMVDARIEGTARASRVAIDLFVRYLRQPRSTPLVLFLDNIDQAPERTVNWLIEICVQTPSLLLVATARSAERLPSLFKITEIKPFSVKQVEQVLTFWFGASPEIKARAAAWHRLSEGNGITLGLIAYIHTRFRDLPGGTDTTLTALVRAFGERVSAEERQEWIQLVACQHRISKRILQLLNGGDTFPLPLEMLSGLPFISEKLNAPGSYLLHARAREVLTIGLGVTESELDAVRDRLIRVVYPRLMEPQLDQGELLTLALERFGYRADFDIPTAAEEIERSFYASVRQRNLARVEELTKLAESLLMRASDKVSISLKLLVAEGYLLNHQPEHAAKLIGSVSDRTLLHESLRNKVRHACLSAQLSTNASPLPGANVFDAINALSVAAELPGVAAEIDLLAEINFELGSALRVAARNRDAVVYYEKVADAACEPALRVRALEESAQVYRLMMNLDAAELALDRARAIRFEYDVEQTGIASYYAANIFRDRDQFERAKPLFARAQADFIEAGDETSLCSLFGDLSWLQYLAGNTAEAQRLSGESLALANYFGFGRELAEYWHAKYHYHADRGEWAQAYECAGKGRELGERYGNVVIHLDCMMHQVQRAARENRLADGEKLLAEMKAVEERGAGIAVYRGRATIYLADAVCAASHTSTAYRLWKEGFEAVGRFGCSRSNVELLSDLAKARVAKIRQAEYALGLKDRWPSPALIADVPALEVFEDVSDK